MGKVKRENLDVQQVADRLRQEIPLLRQDYAVRSLALFGSYVRGEQRRGSDLDVLVEQVLELTSSSKSSWAEVVSVEREERL